MRKTSTCIGAMFAALWPAAAIAETLTTLETNNYGVPGQLLDMPTAEMALDGQLTTTLNYFDGYSKSTLTFQVLPWVSASFRYSGIDDLTPEFSTFYDRSFDLKFRILNEAEYRPAIAIGLQDFIGTGLLGGEYIVATKSIGDRLRVSGGIGWGRFGSANSLGSTGTRPGFDPDSEGGELTSEDWFRGDYALFGGASFAATDRLTFSAEYSSDAYDQEVAAGIFERDTPWSFGATYQASDGILLSAYSLNGSEVGARVAFTLNLKDTAVPGGAELAPLPVAARPRGAVADLGWTVDDNSRAAVRTATVDQLDKAGLDLDGLELSANSAHILLRNQTYNARSQALGRTVRILSRTLPDSIETLHITFVERDIPVSTMTIARRDVERLENAPAEQALERAQFRDSLTFADLPPAFPSAHPRLSWSVGPYVQASFFDPDNPIRANAGIRFNSEYALGSGWIANGQVSVKLFGNLDDIERTTDSEIPNVRSNIAEFLETDDPTIDRLTLAKYGRPAKNIYSRVTMGYLERMYAGVSGEVLWKPVDSRLAIGFEANYVEPRDFDQLFGLRSRETPGGTIPQFNGHGSIYYDLGNGFHTQVDVGRYLAGDWGATLSVDREFANGWRVGAFVTRTDVSAEDFGEGSFDKGIRLTIPFSAALGQPTQKNINTTLRSLTRDGGARLDVDGRLYETVRPSHKPEIAKSWGRFWR